MRKILVGAAAALVGALALMSTASAQDDARIRVLHASPDAPAVDATFEASAGDASALPAGGGPPPTDGSSNSRLWLIAFGAGLLGLVALGGAGRIAIRRIHRG